MTRFEVPEYWSFGSHILDDPWEKPNNLKEKSYNSGIFKDPKPHMQLASPTTLHGRHSVSKFQVHRASRNILCFILKNKWTS